MQDLTDFEWKVEKSIFSTFSHKSVKSVKSCMNGWTDLQVDLSDIVAAHLVYKNLNSHGHSFNIQWDISILLKGIEICKSRVVATLPLNAVTKKDMMPLPNLAQCIEDLQGIEVFSKFDVRWGYNNIRIHEEDQ